MIPICQSKLGTVSLEGNIITQDIAIEIAQALLATWGQVHPKGKAKVVFEIEPKTFSECPHYPTLAEGLEAEGYS